MSAQRIVRLIAQSSNTANLLVYADDARFNFIFQFDEDIRRNLDLFYAPLNDAAAKSYILRR